MDEYALIAARHESDHVSMCRFLGWPLTEVSRRPGLEGETAYEIPIGGDPVHLARSYACILLAPSLHSTVGADADLAKLTEILAISDSVRLSEIVDLTERITRTPEYIRVRRAVEHALVSRPKLSGAEVEELLA
jgi:hypothetical protein